MHNLKSRTAISLHLSSSLVGAGHTLNRLHFKEIMHHRPDALMHRRSFYHRPQILQHERPRLRMAHALTQSLNIVPCSAAHVDDQRDVGSARVKELLRREHIRPGRLGGGVGGHHGLKDGHVGGNLLELVESRKATHVMPIGRGCVRGVHVLRAPEESGQVGEPGEGGIVACKMLFLRLRGNEKSVQERDRAAYFACGKGFGEICEAVDAGRGLANCMGCMKVPKEAHCA